MPPSDPSALPSEHDPRSQQPPRPTWDQIAIAVIGVLTSGLTALQATRELLHTDPLLALVVIGLALLSSAAIAITHLAGRSSVDRAVASGAAAIAVAEAQAQQVKPTAGFLSRPGGSP